MRRRLSLAMGAFLSLAAPKPAQALLCGTFLDPIIVSTTQLNFGSYDAASPAPTTANGTASIKCTLGIDLLPNFTVALSAGGAASFLPRTMSLGGSTLKYNVYSTSSYSASSIWGDSTSGTVVQSYSSVLALGTINFTAFGSVPAGQYVTQGSYSDTLTVTVSF
jgi:spore coat protein U-like protein